MLIYSILAFFAIVVQIIILHYMMEEPKLNFKRIIKYFIFGASSTGLLIILHNWLNIDTTKFTDIELNYFVNMFYNIAFLEELSKYLIFLVVFTVSNRINYTYKNLIFYCAVTMMGFSFIENIFYLVESPPLTIFKRVLFATPLHMTCGLLIGHGFSLGVISKKPILFKILYFLWFFTLAVFLHGIYDFALFYQTWTSGFVSITIITSIAIIYIFNLINKTSKIYG